MASLKFEKIKKKKSVYHYKIGHQIMQLYSLYIQHCTC